MYYIISLPAYIYIKHCFILFMYTNNILYIFIFNKTVHNLICLFVFKYYEIPKSDYIYIYYIHGPMNNNRLIAEIVQCGNYKFVSSGDKLLHITCRS